VSGLLSQIATQVFPCFEIPNWAVRLVDLILLVGLPAALVLASVFELTPEGLRRIEEVTSWKIAIRESTTPPRRRKIRNPVRARSINQTEIKTKERQIQSWTPL
jgi:hypothetical protein